MGNAMKCPDCTDGMRQPLLLGAPYPCSSCGGPGVPGERATGNSQSIGGCRIRYRKAADGDAPGERLTFERYDGAAFYAASVTTPGHTG